jgi:hypothetical protein
MLDSQESSIGGIDLFDKQILFHLSKGLTAKRFHNTTDIFKTNRGKESKS